MELQLDKKNRLSNSSNYKKKLIAIGSSTGGTEAIYYILSVLPKECPPILIVQHMPAVFTKLYAQRLDNNCLLEVREATDGDILYPGLVLIAPGGFQMYVKKSGNTLSVKCCEGDKTKILCPSVDVLFDSVASEVKDDAIGVILTGMGKDGALGLLNMYKNGANTIGQDEKSCIVYGMPKVAYELGGVEIQLPLEEIPRMIQKLYTIHSLK